MKKIIPLLISTCLIIMYAVNSDAQSVNPSKNVYATGESIVISYSGFIGTPKDWIGIAAKGLVEDKYNFSVRLLL